jgi:hypothetical protein
MEELKAFLGALIFLVAGWFLWRRGSRDRSLIRGTATSRIATAPLGFAELAGTARPANDAALRDPVTGQRCLWFKVVTEERSWSKPTKWRVVKSANSSRPFVLEDDSGRCAIEPEEAGIDEHNPCQTVQERWSVRHRIWRIEDGDPLYALGQLQKIAQTARRNAAAAEPELGTQEVNVATAGVLRAWKQDQRQLLAKFDANADGRIDESEWEGARSAALAQAAASLKSAKAAGAQAEAERIEARLELAADITHRMIKPPDARPFLVSKHGEASLSRRRFGNSFAGAIVFFLAAAYLLTALARCVGAVK